MQGSGRVRAKIAGMIAVETVCISSMLPKRLPPRTRGLRPEARFVYFVPFTSAHPGGKMTPGFATLTPRAASHRIHLVHLDS